MSNYDRKKVMAVFTAMRNFDMTISQLSRRVGIGRSCAYNWIQDLKRARFVYIVRWENINTPVYAWGGHPDAPRPQKAGNTATVRKYRQKKSSVNHILGHAIIKETARLTG